jgi:hypothetical protein
VPGPRRRKRSSWEPLWTDLSLWDWRKDLQKMSLCLDGLPTKRRERERRGYMQSTSLVPLLILLCLLVVKPITQIHGLYVDTSLIRRPLRARIHISDIFKRLSVPERNGQCVWRGRKGQ